MNPTSAPKNHFPISTVGRARSIKLDTLPAKSVHEVGVATLYYGDFWTLYDRWDSPDTIVSDGAYGVLGFEGDTSDHTGIPAWYEDHIKAWSERAQLNTTLWFWNSEIGWAAAHPILEKYGWRYMNCNIWNKGIGHIAGNINTAKIRRFPVVSEVCVQYVRESTVNGTTLKVWLRDEWKRAGIPLKRANDACGVKNAATRKYFDQGRLWYYPPPEAFAKLSDYANEHGKPEGRPYYSEDGKTIISTEEWGRFRSTFNCPHGYTNVWDRSALRGAERVTTGPGRKGKAVHLNQKPLDLMEMIIKSSTNKGDVVWEPFGGLFTASLAASHLGRKAFGAEIDPTYYQFGVKRFEKQQQVLAIT